MKWITVKQYADKLKITTSSVYKKIRSGKLQTKKNKGITYVADFDSEQIKQAVKLAEQIEQEQNNRWIELQQNEKKVKLDLQLEKLKNLRQDTILKKLKQQSIKQKYRVEYCEGVLSCFADSFSDLKNFIIELKLDKDKISIFQKIFQKDLKKFEIKLKKYITEKDKEQEDIEDVEQ